MKILLFFLMALLALMVAWFSYGYQQVVETPEQKQARIARSTNLLLKTYTVVIDADYPPYSFRNEKGDLIGFDVDILKNIAETQGFNIKIEARPWDKVIPAIALSQNDIGLGGIEADDIKEAGFENKVTQSIPYVYSIDAIASISPQIDTYEALKYKKVATLADSAYAEDLKSAKNHQAVGQLYEEKTVFLAMKRLSAGNVDAVVADKGVLNYLVIRLPGNAIKINGSGYYFDKYYPMNIISRPNNPQLAQAINQGIATLVQDGTYSLIYQKWFGTLPVIYPKDKGSLRGNDSIVN